MNRVYDILFWLGTISGCHQLPERSFFYRGKQFPVCARCTGAFVGYFFGGITYFAIKIPVWLAVAFCTVMFIDWLMQRIKILKSTNIRRLITGALCGFALSQMYVRIMIYIIDMIKTYCLL